MYRIYLTLLLCLLMTSPMLSQTLPDVPRYGDLTYEKVEGKWCDIDVNGLQLWDTLAKEDFVKKFGVPTMCHNEDGRFDSPVEPKHRMYYYDSTFFETYDDEFRGFFISSPDFKVLTRYYSNGLGVGDHISVLKDFKDGILCIRGKNWYQLQDQGDGYFCFRTDDAGYIISIDYSFPC
jgi:hypothetical protein